MPELEGQAATQREYLSDATPPDCEKKTNWPNVGLQKTIFSVACFKLEAFRHPPVFHAYSFIGMAHMPRQFIKPPGPPEYLS